MTTQNRRLVLAAASAAAVGAQVIAGKATRDALFLTSLHISALPTMVVVMALTSLAVVALHVRASRHVRPGVLVPSLFAGSAVLFLLESLLRPYAPSAVAIAVYLHTSSIGPLLVSSFWLVTSERFDPHTARRQFGQIAGIGTLGGLVSALIAERAASRLGVPAMLPWLAVLQLVGAALIWKLADGTPAPVAQNGNPAEPTVVASLKTIGRASYLRHLAVLVMLGSVAAAFVDFLFKARAVEVFGGGETLLRFFAVYYAGTSLAIFLIQTLSTSAFLSRFGLAFSTSTPSMALVAGGLGSLIDPTFAALVAARGGEAVLRTSLFSTGYELFYTPIPSEEKRAAKSMIDVGAERMGDAIGGSLIRFVVMLAPATSQGGIVLALAVACSMGAILVSSRLNRVYVRTLEHSLKRHGARQPQGAHNTLKTIMRGTLGRERAAAINDQAAPTRHDSASVAAALAGDPDLLDILRLRSQDRFRVVRVLARSEGLSRPLVPHVIALLSWEAVAEHAVFALRKVAEENVGVLTDALLNPSHSPIVRRRLARVLSIGVSQRAADSLTLALEDSSFEVRRQAARSLLALLERNPRIRISREAVLNVVRKEIGSEHRDALAHTFTLLALIMDREPLEVAFRSLQGDDPNMVGTAVEYLEEVLPSPVRERLWPYLESQAHRAAV